MKEESKRARWILVALLAILLFTRTARHLLGIHLPDAAVAAFFLAGSLGLGARGLAVLLVGAAGLDLLQFGLGASQACVSPGYPLLFVGYAASWFSGWLAQDSAVHWKALAMLVAGLVAFAFSSGGYYALSGKFASPSLAEFLVRSQVYLPDFMINVVLYAAPGLVLALGLSRLGAYERA